MAAKGQPKSGGRKKGVPNKSTAVREAEIRASGLVPMDYYLAILRSQPTDDMDEAQKYAHEQKRFAAAKELMPYCHARLASVEARTDVNIHEAWLDQLD